MEIIIAIVCSSGFTAALMHWLNRDTRKLTNAGSSIELSEKVTQLIDERVKEAEKLRQAETKQAAAEFMVKLLQGQVATADERMERVLIEQGKAEEREKQCAKRLHDLEVRVSGLTELETTNQRQASEILQLRAKVDEYERTGEIHKSL